MNSIKELRMSRKSAGLSVVFVLICWGVVVVPASAQHFQRMAGSLTQVAVGRNEVWGINASNQTYRFSPGNKQFLQIPVSLIQVAVGGGTLLQNDEVWGINASGAIYRFNFSTKKLVQVPGVLAQIAVGEGDEEKCHRYEVWGFNPNLLVYRYNYCSSQWEQISSPPLTHIATGGGDVWGLDEFAQIWHYDFQQGGWTQITNGGYFGTLQQIAVGVNDVWGLDGNGAAYRYDPTYNTFNTLYTGGAIQTHVAAGGNGVWVIYNYGAGTGLVARFDSQIEALYYEGGGPFVQIAVGSGGGVWGVNSSKSSLCIRPTVDDRKPLTGCPTFRGLQNVGIIPDYQLVDVCQVSHVLML
jgi:hypothetical protein